MVALFKKTDDSIRIPASIAVQTGEHETSCLFFTQNISMTGMYLESESLLPEEQIRVGDEIKVFFYLPSGKGTALAAKAKVVRREQLTNINGESVHAIAITFVDMESGDRENLRLFIADYETELENAVLSDLSDKETEEPTDPETILATLADQAGELVFETTTIDDYKELYCRVEEIDQKLDRGKKASIAPMELLLIEVIEKFRPQERQQLDHLIGIRKPNLKEKIYLNLFFLRIKLLTEYALLNSALERVEIGGKEKRALSAYLTSACYEADLSNEAAHLVGQKLISEENWRDFKLVNALRRALDQAIQQLQQLLQSHQIVAGDALELEKSQVITRLNLEECLAEVKDIIPDPEEEKDDFPSGATGNDIRELWDKIFSVSEGEIKEKLFFAFALRRKVRHSYLQCRDLGESIINHRAEVTAIFREDTKMIKETVAKLMAMNVEMPNTPQAESADLITRLLEALALEFGKLVRTIPRRMLTTEEVDTVRFRHTTFRRHQPSKLDTLRRFSRAHGVWVSMTLMLLITLLYHMVNYYHARDQVLPIRLVGTLKVDHAFKVGNDCLYVTVQKKAWQRLLAKKRQSVLNRMAKIAHDESVERFKLIDEKNNLLALSFIDHEGKTFITHLTGKPKL